MARHEKTITIQDEGRDKGKVFVIREMPATAGEKWAMQLMYLIEQAGAAVSQETLTGGMAGLATLMPEGRKDAMALAVARALGDPSLAAWWDCVRYVHAPNHQPQKINLGETCQIEEIKTITFLRMEVVKLHTDFFSPENPSSSGSPSPEPTHTGSSPTRISRPRSVP
jgi:hypothetical protein